MNLPNEKSEGFPQYGSDRIIHNLLAHANIAPMRYSLHVLDRIRNAEYAEWSASHGQKGFPDFTTGITSASKILKESLLQPSPENITHSLRAKASLVVIDEFFYAPILFSDRSAFVEERRDLLEDNAQYERLGIVLQDTLETLDQHGESLHTRQNLRGFIQEITLATLLNRKSGKLGAVTRLALPAGFAEDHFRKTDVELYSFYFDGTGKKLPIQVKSTDFSEDKNTITPENGIVLFAKDFYNDYSDDFIVSRLITEELTGNARPEVSPLLDEVQKKVLHTIAERRRVIVK